MAEKYILLSAAVAIIEEKQRELCPVGRFSRNAIYGSDRNRFDDLQETIDAIEAIEPADVQPVVCCKDCIYWKSYPSPTGEKKYCSVFDWINSSAGEDYCSFAEKRGADMRPEPLEREVEA